MIRIAALFALALLACSAPATQPVQPRPVEPGPGPTEPTPTEPQGAICGTRGAAECPADMACIHPLGAQCGQADAPGRCEKKPEACPTIAAPVCGCDGKTYPNECSAKTAGTGVMSEGECPAAGG